MYEDFVDHFFTCTDVDISDFVYFSIIYYTVIMNLVLHAHFTVGRYNTAHRSCL